MVELDRVAKDFVADVLSDAGRKEIDVGFQFIEPIATKGEPVMIAAMIRNLLDNAARFTPGGGRVDIGVYRDAGEAVVQIEDTGPGIPPGDMDRIFEPFFRGSQPIENGTGLGLSIVKRIVDRLGGSIVLENMSGPSEMASAPRSACPLNDISGFSSGNVRDRVGKVQPDRFGRWHNLGLSGLSALRRYRGTSGHRTCLISVPVYGSAANEPCM